MQGREDLHGFWSAACRRALDELARQHPSLTDWSIRTEAYFDARHRAGLEDRANADGFVGEAWGYFDRDAKCIVVAVDAGQWSSERPVRDALESAGIDEDDPEVAVAWWIVRAVSGELSRRT